jgi:hypothetical protein
MITLSPSSAPFAILLRVVKLIPARLELAYSGVVLFPDIFTAFRPWGEQGGVQVLWAHRELPSGSCISSLRYGIKWSRQGLHLHGTQFNRQSLAASGHVFKGTSRDVSVYFRHETKALSQKSNTT